MTHSYHPLTAALSRWIMALLLLKVVPNLALAQTISSFTPRSGTPGGERSGWLPIAGRMAPEVPATGWLVRGWAYHVHRPSRAA